MSVLEITGVTKNYGALRAVNNASLNVNEGEAVAIIGSSGSGKSTLLRCVNNLEQVDKGSIKIDGEYIVSDAVYRKEKEVRKIRTKTAMVFQHFNLFPHLTCIENITLAPVEILNKPKAYVEELAWDLLGKVGLADKANCYPAQISGGQKQRIAIARALAMEPKIMLFDEPTSALDPENIGSVTNVIYNLAKIKTTMLIVTHDMNFAREASSRIVFMDDGSILEEGDPKEVLSNPKCGRLQEFLTNIN